MPAICTISRIEIGAGIIFACRRDGNLAVQTSHAAADVNLAHVRIGFGGVAIKGVKFRSFIRLFSRPVEQDEVHDARDAIGTVNGRSAILQDFGAAKAPDRDGIDVVEIETCAVR